MAHNELLHEEHPPEKEGEAPRCSLYPGLRCRDHLDIAVEVDNSRFEHLPRVPFVALCPNSWLIAPTGGFPERSASSASKEADEGDSERLATDPYAAVRQIDERDQFTAAGIRRHVEALQKLLGTPLDPETGTRVAQVLEAAETLTDDDKWREALVRLVTLEKHVPAAPLSLRRLLTERLTAINEAIEYEFEDLKDAKDVAGVRTLTNVAATEVLKQQLPIAKAMQAWLKAQTK